MSATVGTTYKPWTISAVNPVWSLGWAQVEADPRETHLNHDASPFLRLAASRGGGSCQRHRGPRRRRLARPQHGRHRRQAPRRRQAAAVLAAPGRGAARGARPPHGAGRHVAVAGPLDGDDEEDGAAQRHGPRLRLAGAVLVAQPQHGRRLPVRPARRRAQPRGGPVPGPTSCGRGSSTRPRP